jgi:putative DNA primase/helicase
MKGAKPYAPNPDSDTVAEFNVEVTDSGWRLSLAEPLEVRASGGASPRGSIRVTLQLWSRTGGGDSLLFIEECVLSKEKEREEIAEKLSAVGGAPVPATALLALAEAIQRTPPPKAKAKELQGQAMALESPEPWSQAVDGADLLTELAATFQRFVALPEGAADALALWVLHTYTHDAADVSPRLAITSPAKRCGKTTLLTVLGSLVPRPLPSANITAAVLFRAVEQFKPTVLIDEADTFLEAKEELRGLLNAGHYRAGAFVLRAVGEEHEPRLFTVWAPVAVAMIGELPDTLADRSLEVRMQRQKPGTVERLRLDQLHRGLEPVRRKAQRWAADNAEALSGADPETPSGISDRAADNWRALLSIADLTGGEWPERARASCRQLTGSASEDDDAGTLLLLDLRSIFEAHGQVSLPTKDVLRALHELENRPWGDWKKGNAITAHGLARLLRRFGIAPKQFRDGEDKKQRGYWPDMFADAWARYTPTEAVQAVQDDEQGQSSDSIKRYRNEAVPLLESGENPDSEGNVPLVPSPDPPPETGEDGSGLPCPQDLAELNRMLAAGAFNGPGPRWDGVVIPNLGAALSGTTEENQLLWLEHNGGGS